MDDFQLIDEGLEDWADKKLRELLRLAHLVEQRYKDETEIENKKRDYKERSALSCRARIHKGTLSIEWYRVRIVKLKDGNRVARSKTIRKGLKNSYNLGELISAGKYWQAPLIEETEKEFTRIRILAKAVGKMRAAGRMAERQLAKLDALEVEEESF